MFALMDEPERAGRVGILAVGAVLAFGIQGGTLYSASRLARADLVKNVPVEMRFFEPPPPTAPPPPTQPPPPLPTEPPKPKPRTPPPVVPPPVVPPVPKTPRPVPASESPPVVGLDVQSTTETGPGPVFQIGNTQYGKPDRVARPAPAGPPPTGAPPADRVGPPIIREARALLEIKPDYSPDARAAEIEGEVIVLLTLDERGNVVDVKIIRGLGYGQDERVLATVRRWKYEPKLVDGVPVRTTIKRKIQFTLE